MGQIFGNAAMGHHHPTGERLFGILQHTGYRQKTGPKKWRQIEIVQRFIHRNGNIFQKSAHLSSGVGLHNQSLHRS